MASGWNVWVWLECIGVVSGCCCIRRYNYRYSHYNYYFSLLHALVSAFLQQHPYFFFHFKNVFSFLFMLFLCNVIIKNF